MDERLNKIVATWVIGVTAVAVYFTTELFMLSALILFFAFPLRSGLYEDDTLTGAIKDMPILSAVCAIAMFGQFLFHLYNLLRTHSSESLTVPTISLILFPMLVLYFMRDIELYRRIRNTRGQ